MFFNRKNRALTREHGRYLDCDGLWYFRIEYYENWCGNPKFMYFESLRDAEYWIKNTSGLDLILCLTDRQGNRILTDWIGSGAGPVNLWTDVMGRQVLDLRKGENVLWVPANSIRAKKAKS